MRNECTTWQQFFDDFCPTCGYILACWCGSELCVTIYAPLEVEEFRGFAISDNLAPLSSSIAETRGPLRFHTSHDWPHLDRCQRNISNPAPKKRRTETFSRNRNFLQPIAAQLLIPASGLESHWTDQYSVSENIRRIADGPRQVQCCVDEHTISKKSVIRFFLQLLDDEYRNLISYEEDDEGGEIFRLVQCKEHRRG